MNQNSISLLALLLMGTMPVIAADSGATVTTAINQVDHGSSNSASAAPAKVGTVLHDGEYLKTGVKSRAELELANQAVTRLGANTIFNYSAANNEIDLQAGTVLFSKPKDGSQMNIKTASVTAAVVGTTGFAKYLHNVFLFGLIEGHATVTINGVVFHLKAGEAIRFTPGSQPQLFPFNLSLLLQTSTLITGFKHPLPNQAYIDQELARYNELVSRGFIEPAKYPYFVIDENQSVPTIPFIAIDSAGMILGPSSKLNIHGLDGDGDHDGDTSDKDDNGHTALH